MQHCPKCGTPHTNKGTYCSRKCANSRIFSEESKQRKRDSQNKYWNSLSESDKNEKILVLHSITSKVKSDYLSNLFLEEWRFLSRQNKRLKVILEQNGKCNKCGIFEWNNIPITLEFEHKNGNKFDNSRENVEALCPNCHSQTKTWRGRQNGLIQKRVLEYIKRNNQNYE
jgi:5-methylcytosine-specific restriction endonuclease McrA